MAESVLSKLVKTDKETKEHLESIDSNLVKVYKLQLKTEKREAKQAKREAQRKKRSGGDFLQNLALPDKEKKKARKSFLESIGEFFKGIGGALLGGLGSLIGPLFKMGGPIAGIITGAFKKIFDKKLLSGIGSALGKVLKNPLFWKAALVVALGIGATKLFGQSKSTLDKKRGVTERGTRFSGQDIEGMAKKEAKGYTFDDKTKEYINEDGDVDKAMTERQAIYRSLQRDMQKYGVAEMNIREAEKNIKKNEALLKREKDQYHRERYQRDIKHSQGIIKMFEGQLAMYDKKIKTKIKRLNLKDEEIVNFQLSQGRRNPDQLPANIDRSKIDFSNIGNPLTNQFTFTDYGDHIVKKQTGGPLTVPGTGSGDKVPMMLPEGSFVMNRNAAQMGYQKGGIPRFQSGGLVPTLLEPGEHVYGPGQWNASHMMMNSAIPRFQEGGAVLGGKIIEYLTGDSTHSGYRADHGGSNYHEHLAFESTTQRNKAMKILRDSGITIGSVNSGTHAPNSYHYRDLAFDVPASQVPVGQEQALSRRVRKILSEAGFKGAGIGGDSSSGSPREGSEPNANNPSHQSASQGILSGLTSIGGDFGKFLQHVASSLGGLTGELAGLGQGLFGGMGALMGNDSSSPSTSTNLDGSLSTASAPLSGGLAATAKQMYDYIKSKGLSDAQAKGIVANIQRESTFDIDAVGDGGTSFGLFQWHAGRGTRMKAAVPNWATNWQGQIDYALQEHVGPKYKGDTAGMSAKEAAYWWMNRWEIPEDRARGGPNHRKMNGFIDAYQFQRGGRVSRAGQSNNYQMSMQHSLRRHLGRSKKIHVMPQIEPSRPSSNANPGAQNQPPVLDAYPTNVVAMDLAYRTSIGGVF